MLMLAGNSLGNTHSFRLTLAGWNTSTTRERVNGIVNAGVCQVDFEPVLNGEIIDSSDWFASNQKLPDPLVW